MNRMVVRFGKKNVTPVLHDLHGFPVERHDHFKVLLFTHKILNEYAPVLMCNMVEIYKPAKPLRSGTDAPKS